MRAKLRAQAKIEEIPELEHLPEGPAVPEADLVVSAPVVTGGPMTGALPRTKHKTSARIKAALERAVATSEGKEPPKVSEAGVDLALKEKFGEAARAKAEALEAAAAPESAPTTGPGGALVFAIPEETEPIPRESFYDPSYDEVARLFAANGATDYEIADLLNVSTRTITRWKAAHVSFKAAIALGAKENLSAQIENVERSMYTRAVGYTQVTEKVMQFKGQVLRVPQLEHVPGDVGAQKHFLANRDPEKWRIDPDKLQTENPAAKALEAMAILELARRMGQVLIEASQVERVIDAEALDVSASA